MNAIILQTVLCITSTICLWSAFLLVYNWQGVRQRRWLSIVMIFWGLSWAFRAYGLIFSDTEPSYSIILPPYLILAGTVSAATFLIWPLSVLKPSGLNGKKILLFWAPFIVCVAAYWGLIGILGLQQFSFTSLTEFSSHISYFSVWYRLVMCACVLGYLIYTIKLTVIYIRRYNRYVAENYSEYEKYTINWMPMYLAGLVAISITYFVNLCFASYSTMLCHNIIAGIFFAWLSAKVMVYNSPFKSDIDGFTILETIDSKGEDFNSMFSNYKLRIETWLDTERPYLKQDFSLQEIMDKFNLNRTYASKIFNEGFGKSFLLVVRDYRIDYAKKIIESNPAIAMVDVAHICGYSTPQAFHKAFVYCNDGLTPGKFASSIIENQ